MAFNISYVYQAIDKFTPVANKIKRSVDSVRAKVNSASSSLKNFGNKISGIGAKVSAFVSTSLGFLGIGMLKAAATMESMQVSFETMLGSADKAKKLMKDLVFFAAKTPFELTGIGNATKQLLAFGVPQEEIIEKLQMLGDVASSSEKISLSDMAAIFGKIKTKGKAMTEEIMQMGDRGIPIIDILSKRFNISKEAIFEMASKGKLSFKMIEDSLKSMTSKGGIYHNMMIKQSKTLNGLFSTMKDVIFAASATMGDSLIEVTNLKEKMVQLSNWIEKATIKIQSLSPQVKQIIVYGGMAVAALGPFLLLIGGLTLAMGLLLSPIGLVVGGITAITAAALKFKPIGDAFRVFFHLSRLAAEQLVISFKAVGKAISDFMPDFGIIEKITNSLGRIGGGFSMSGFADYLSEQTVAIENKRGGVAVKQANNTTTVQGNINVNAPPGVVNSVDLSSKGKGANLGLSMQGAQ